MMALALNRTSLRGCAVSRQMFHPSSAAAQARLTRHLTLAVVLRRTHATERACMLVTSFFAAPQAWLAGHLTLAVALRMMREGVGRVDSTRSAAQLLQRIILQAHTEIMQVPPLLSHKLETQQTGGARCL